MKLVLGVIAATAAVGVMGSVSRAGGSVVTIGSPAVDTWMYPPGAGGFSPYAPSFAAPFFTQDPNRMGFVLLVFDTADVVLGAGEEVVGLTLRVRLLNSSTFDPADGYIYDDTQDPVASYGDEALDLDPGRPVEAYAAIFAEGVTLAGWAETTPVFGANGYNAVPADFSAGEIRDVQNNVNEGFEVAPLAVGVTGDVFSDGGVVKVADLATVSFVIDLTGDAAARSHFTGDAASGRVALVVSSLHVTGEFGEGGEVFPRWATKESFGPLDASLDVEVGVVEPPCVGDLDGDGSVGSTDLNLVLAGFGTSQGSGDVDGSGSVDSVDLNLLLAAFGDVCS